MYNMRSKKNPEWARFEEDVATYIDGVRQEGSGCSPIAYKKGDVRSDDLLVECKYTSKDCYTLSNKTWEKIYAEAVSCFKTPLFACRSKAGDFLVGSALDFDVPEGADHFEGVSRLKIDREMEGSMSSSLVKGGTHQLVCWRVSL